MARIVLLVFVLSFTLFPSNTQARNSDTTFVAEGGTRVATVTRIEQVDERHAVVEYTFHNGATVIDTMSHGEATAIPFLGSARQPAYPLDSQLSTILNRVLASQSTPINQGGLVGKGDKHLLRYVANKHQKKMTFLVSTPRESVILLVYLTAGPNNTVTISAHGDNTLGSNTAEDLKRLCVAALEFYENRHSNSVNEYSQAFFQKAAVYVANLN